MTSSRSHRAVCISSPSIPSASLFRARTVSLLALLLLLGSLLPLTGCGNATSSTLTRGPVVSTALPANAGSTFTVTNASAPATGKNVVVRVEISSTTALDVTSHPPSVNFLDTNSKSLFGGAQTLQSVDSDPNGWTYSFNVPATTPTATYTVVIYAQDTFGNKGNTPYTVGTISLP